VAIAYQRFRHLLEKQFAVAHSLSAGNPALLQGLASRFGVGAAGIQKNLRACENATGVENLPQRKALALVQALHDDEAFISAKAVPE
jgi:flagellar motor protein MotB